MFAEKIAGTTPAAKRSSGLSDCTISATRAADVAASRRMTISPDKISTGDTAASSGLGSGASITIGANSAPARSGTGNLPSFANRRHDDKWFGRRSCRRATLFTVTPGTRVSATTCPLNASHQRRLPDGPTMTSIRQNSSIWCSIWPPKSASIAKLHSATDSQIRQPSERWGQSSAYPIGVETSGHF